MPRLRSSLVLVSSSNTPNRTHLGSEPGCGALIGESLAGILDLQTTEASHWEPATRVAVAETNRYLVYDTERRRNHGRRASPALT